MHKIPTYVLVLIFLAVFVGNIFAAPPYINYQGRLVDSIGNPLNGDYNITFRIFDALTVGIEKWSEVQTVNMDNGVFNAALGSVTPLTSSVFSSNDRYLEVQIGSDSPMTPRTRLLSVPYALYTSNVGSPDSAVTISTHTTIASSQLRLGNYASDPTSVGAGSLIYDSGDNQVKYHNGTMWIALSAGGVSPWILGSGTAYVMDSNNNVGIGTSSPLYKLHISSGAGEAGNIVVVSTGVSNIFTLNGNGEVTANKYYGDGSNLTGIVTSDKVLKAGDTMTGALTMDTATAFTTSNQPYLNITTNVVIAASQFRLGNFASTPGTLVGDGAMYYNSSDNLLYYYNGSGWAPLASGGASPWTGGGTGSVTLGTASDEVGIGKAPGEKLDVAGNIKADYGIIASTAVISDTSANALDVAGGIQAGSGNVGIVDATGKIPAISATYFTSVDGSALTGLTATQVGLGNVDDTADTAKPVSAAQQIALDAKAVYADVTTDTTTIAGNLATEITDRTSGDSALSSRLDTVA
ncbi:MAG: hypothetical protein L6420_01330, partial [Elusimicrobia bacterium]|nr:hypothetical protein [Elusimicrobiota bacterium]